MEWVSTGVKVALDSLKICIKHASRSISKRKQKELISKVIRELLKLDPDLDAVDATLAAVEATGAEPTAELFRVRRMRHNVASYKKKMVKKKTKKKAKKRMAKKKAKKKSKKKAKKKK